MKILIVNERGMMKAGHTVITAADGEEGLRRARKRKPDLVGLDMLLPKLSGPEVWGGCVRTPEMAAIPVIVLTSLPQSNEQKLIKEGAASCLAKSDLTLDNGTTLLADAVERMLLKPVRKLQDAELFEMLGRHNLASVLRKPPSDFV
jgi:CheY-like chemotaxis protein